MANSYHGHNLLSTAARAKAKFVYSSVTAWARLTVFNFPRVLAIQLVMSIYFKRYPLIIFLFSWVRRDIHELIYVSRIINYTFLN